MELQIENKIYELRGVQTMLDFDSQFATSYLKL
jgi:hypothetical protein